MSAKTGENVNEAFNYLVKEIYSRNKVSQPEPTAKPAQGFKLKSAYQSEIKEDRKKKKSDCCWMICYWALY